MGLSQALFRTEDPGNDYYVIFDLFNEGVTEHIAMMMSREYLRRSPLSMPNGDTLESAQFEEFLALQNNARTPKTWSRRPLYARTIEARSCPSCCSMKRSGRNSRKCLCAQKIPKTSMTLSNHTFCRVRR